MRLDYFVMCEGVAQDAQGLHSAIRLNANILVTPSLPTRTKRGLLLHLVDPEDSLQPGDIIQIDIRVDAPSGHVITATSEQAEVAGKRWPDMPGEMMMAGEVGLGLNEYGRHVITATVKAPRHEPQSAELALFVSEAPPSTE